MAGRVASWDSSIHDGHGGWRSELVRLGVLVNARDGHVDLGVGVLLVHLEGPEWHAGAG